MHSVLCVGQAFKVTFGVVIMIALAHKVEMIFNSLWVSLSSQIIHVVLVVNCIQFRKFPWL